jgi:O-antigen ligase
MGQNIQRSVSRFELLAIVAIAVTGPLSWEIARQKRLTVLVFCMLLLTIVLPIEMSIGMFAFCAPYDLALGQSGMTVSSIAGAYAGTVLLIYGLASKRFRIPPQNALWWGLFTLWTAASVLWAISPADATERLFTVLTVFALYVVATSFQFTDREITRILWLSIAGGVLASAVVLFGQGVVSGRRTLELAGEVSNANQIATDLLLPFSLAFAGALFAKNSWNRSVLIGSMVLIATAIFMTMSRSTLAALCAITLVFLVRIRERRRVVLPTLLLLIPLLFVPKLFDQRLEQAVTSRGEGRFDIFLAGLQIVKHNPLLGVGLNNFGIAYDVYAGEAPVFRGFRRDAHNTYLAVIAETGVIGFCLFVIALYTQIRRIAACSSYCRHYRTIALEATCWGLLIAGLAGDLEWKKGFWLVAILAILTSELENSFRGPAPAQVIEYPLSVESKSFQVFLIPLLFTILCSFPFATCAFSSTTSGTYHYVSPNGSDANPGTLSRPWATIQHAANEVAPGDTVFVEDGTFRETLRFSQGGTPQAPVTFKALHRWRAIVAPDSSAKGTIVDLQTSNIVFQDFEVIGTPGASDGIKINYENAQVLGNKVHDVGVNETICNSGAGITDGTAAVPTGSVIRGNWVYNIGPSRTAPFGCNQQHGIYIAAPGGGIVANNVIFQVWQGYAIHAFAANLSNWTISNNTIFNSGDDRHRNGGPMVIACESGVCDFNVFTNNIMVDTQHYCFFEAEYGGVLGIHNRYLNNLTHHCGREFGSNWVKGSAQNTIDADPQFLNYTGDTTGNYHLRPISPGLGRGTRIGAQPVDFDNVPRPSDAGIDIGAYQMNGR